MRARAWELCDVVFEGHDSSGVPVPARPRRARIRSIVAVEVESLEMASEDSWRGRTIESRWMDNARCDGMRTRDTRARGRVERSSDTDDDDDASGDADAIDADADRDEGDADETSDDGGEDGRRGDGLETEGGANEDARGVGAGEGGGDPNEDGGWWER